MNVAIMHYHLNRGGVTQVIANHLRALQAVADGPETVRVALLYGGRREDWPEGLPAELDRLEITLRPVAGLDYDDGQPPRPAELAGSLRAALQELGFAAGETVVQIHNHALGKNVSLPGALGELAQAGYGLLLQIHDFAEDFRPENYRRLVDSLAAENPATLPAAIYPQGPNIHYAVLNGRDSRVLQEAGVSGDRLHSLPNPAGEFGALPSRTESRNKLRDRFGVPTDRPLAIYPVRGIRRKNLGEALLWAALCGGAVWFGTTLPPLNPAEQPSYERWKELAAELKLPVVFELGAPDGLGYLDNLAAADLLLTTSVAEGFGMVFLESYLAGRALVGRDLTEITGDFAAAGLRLDGLHARFNVPLAWISQREFQDGLQRPFEHALRQYGLEEPPRETLRKQMDALVQDGSVDFAVLSGGLQRDVIVRVHGSEQARGELLRLNPWVRSAVEHPPNHEATVSHNAGIIRQQYSLEQCGRRLVRYCQAVLASPAATPLEPPPHGERILNGFLSLSRFHPIRVEK